MWVNYLLIICGIWWLLSYVLDYECEIIDKLYCNILLENPEEPYPLEMALFLAGGPIRLTGELLKERSNRKR